MPRCEELELGRVMSFAGEGCQTVADIDSKAIVKISFGVSCSLHSTV